MIGHITLPPRLKVGANALAELPQLLKDLGSEYPLIITDQTMVELGYADRLTKLLKHASVAYNVFADTQAEPTAASLQNGIELARGERHDSLIALGGGSPIDSAKAIALLSVYGGKIRDFCVPNIVQKKGLPVIAIPTTAGTGSEATKFTIITDETNDEKLLCAGPAFMPAAALIDYTLTLSLPPRITADTGIDALTHAIEAYVSRKATPFSDTQALSAMGLLAPNLRRVYHDGSDETAREAMMLGSTLAGIAFSNASVALVHGMSRPIGAHFHVPHGLSNAMLLPTLTAWSIPGSPQRYAACARAMGLCGAEHSEAEACERLCSELTQMNQDLEVPTPAAYGIDQATYLNKLPLMAEQAKASGSPANNPRIPTEAEMITLYEQIWT